MISLFKRIIFLWMIFFSTFLHADLLAYKHITISDASGVYESNGPLQFNISIDASPSSFMGIGGTLTVHYKTIISTTATSPEDYSYTEGDVTFNEGGVTSKVITVPITNDNEHESTEYVYVEISENNLLYQIDDNRGKGTIYDDDALPLAITVNDSYITENDGTSTASFHVTLNQNAPEGGVKVSHSTADDSALAGSDYTAQDSFITINEGVSSGYIYIPIIGDTLPEHTKQYKLNLSTSTGSINSEAIGTIYDDDVIKVYVECSDTDEGNDGESNNISCRIYLEKDYPLEDTLTIDYASADGSDPSATANDDYTPISGTVTFNKNDQEKFVNIPTIGDNIVEEDELVQLNISGSSYIITSSSIAEIINDDGDYPSLSFDSSNFSIIEGNSSTSTLNFTFTLDAPALEGSSFDYYTQDNSAEAESDYEKIELKTYLIAKDARNITIPVIINGDTDIEEDEYFYLRITHEKDVVVHGHIANGWIINDDGSYPEISFSTESLSLLEGNISKDINITLTLDQPAMADTHFDYYTYDGSATTDDNDYVAIARNTYTIPEGNSSITIPVTINGDNNIEEDERFYFEIDKLNNIELADGDRSSITLLNDDGSYPLISIESADYSIIEGNSSTQNLEIKLTLDSPALADSNISYYTRDGSASDGSSSTEDNDYTPVTNTISIAEGTRSLSIEIPILGDTYIEPDENFYFYIHEPRNLEINRDHTNITIENDDTHNEEAFECDEHMYISSSKKRGSEDTGRMWLHRIDTSNNPFKFEVMDDEGEANLYNAIAYNPEDNYIYGLYYRELIKISRTGKVMSQGTINALPSELDDYQLFAGAIFDNENYYVAGVGVNSNKMFKINLLDKNVTEIILSESINIKDFSFSPNGDYLYGIIDGGQFVKINATDGIITRIGDAHAGEFDSTFSDKNGRFFANDSEGNGFYEFDISTGEKSFLSNSQPATFNDGANCLKGELLFTDYGDAPISYGPSWHNIANGIYLGNNVDHDIDSYDTINADGDDLNGVDDDDGVTLSDGSDINGTYFETNTTHKLKVKLSKEAYLKIWIDLDINGHFDAASDLVYNSNSKLSAGEHTINFTLPDGLTINQTTYLRARVSSSPSLNPTGLMTDGEVEDYAIKFGSEFMPLRGVFNIERTDSSNYLINSDERNAWYTQIVGRDFDYSVLFYEEDMSTEKVLDNVTVKLEIVDQEHNDSVIYQRYAHIKNDPPKSRIDIVLPAGDLISLPATKRAIFRISYGVDGEGAIWQANCEVEPQTCYEANPFTRTDYAFDNFAIRPETFYISLSDGTQERINSRMPTNSISLASGYEYNLNMIATQYGSLFSSAGYNKSFNASFEFNATGVTACADTSAIGEFINFNNGLYNNANFSHHNVGHYTLNIKEDENWTDIDHNDDCILGESFTSTDGNSRSGCNIKLQTNPIMLNFFPDHFKVDLNLSNFPDSNHSDFIYMSELNSTYQRVAIGFQGEITAQTEDNISTSNFTSGCMATPIALDLNSTTRSVEGINKLLHTVEGTDVAFSRLIRYNNDFDISHLDYNGTLPYINRAITIDADKFMDDKNGTLFMDLRYNINKNLEEPINPVQISFHGIEVNSTSSTSLSHDQVNITATPHLPKGNQRFLNNVKNFYFAQVAPDLINYPKVNMHISPLVQTPLNVDIYCAASNSYCTDTNVTFNSNWNSSERKQDHFYLSVHHDPNLDGNVTELNPNPAIVTIIPDPTPSGASDTTLPNGRSGFTTTEFNTCTSPNCIVTIVSDPAITFTPKSHYQVNCSNIDPSKWTGVGQTGNIIESQPQLTPSGRMEW